MIAFLRSSGVVWRVKPPLSHFPSLVWTGPKEGQKFHLSPLRYSPTISLPPFFFRPQTSLTSLSHAIILLCVVQQSFFNPASRYYFWLNPAIPPPSECLSRPVRFAVLRVTSVTCDFPFLIPDSAVNFNTIPRPICH